MSTPVPVEKKSTNRMKLGIAAALVLLLLAWLLRNLALGTPVDHRTDLYSAGIIFYELLTGRKPFRAESPAGLVYQHIHTIPPALPAAVALAQPIVDMLLAKDPEARFGSAEELLDSLDEWLSGPAWRALSPPQGLH